MKVRKVRPDNLQLECRIPTLPGMRLLRSTDLALRVLMRLAVAGDSRPTTRDVAAAVDVPYTHAAKVVAELQHRGLLIARRGRGGGLSLTEKGRGASVGALVRSFEGEGDVVECEGGSSVAPCPLRSDCRLRGALRRAQEAFFASLDPITVADIAADPTGPLLLGIPRAR
ncbi:HTH-type transcriptional repressor NsrR [Streptomyces capillispiralis]|uniref:BadM/Rrf2 family transcriptional regulator n=2 Tax=Streptomyces capillispiralis TaxID=68182 RepID=A0A561TLJ4_9ACTN|nr:BadM/Rrf2 family transcriptional regulator [Streptomyces capillispiralis]GHH94909.1 HTH-type transcriptional repressor NsrR [Streptomyces capillispiralis]